MHDYIENHFRDSLNRHKLNVKNRKYRNPIFYFYFYFIFLHPTVHFDEKEEVLTILYTPYICMYVYVLDPTAGS